MKKRMLQEAVDALIDNGRRGKPVVAQNNRELKIFIWYVKRKTRKIQTKLTRKKSWLLSEIGYRCWAILKMNQCGIPKKMALELYKPFIMRELVRRELANNIKMAKKLVEESDDKVWAVSRRCYSRSPCSTKQSP